MYLIYYAITHYVKINTAKRRNQESFIVLLGKKSWRNLESTGFISTFALSNNK